MPRLRKPRSLGQPILWWCIPVRNLGQPPKPKGTEGLQQFSAVRLMNDTPDYFVYNGAVDGLTTTRAMKANVGETVRAYTTIGETGEALRQVLALTLKLA
ncbi:MAG TPA: hypothetical protein VF447_04870 [Terriglobales bacterium]